MQRLPVGSAAPHRRPHDRALRLDARRSPWVCHHRGPPSGRQGQRPCACGILRPCRASCSS